MDCSITILLSFLNHSTPFFSDAFETWLRRVRISTACSGFPSAIAVAVSDNSCFGQSGVVGDAEEDAQEEDDDDVGEGETVFSGITTGVEPSML